MGLILVSLFAGGLFGAGLMVSQMISPQKVLGFLDVTGAWDPSLAFVIGGALALTVPAFFLIKKRQKPVLCETFDFPENTKVTPKLVLGMMLFGIGWGLVGFCPGPALSAIAFMVWQPLVFVAAMIAGMVIYDRIIKAMWP